MFYPTVYFVIIIKLSWLLSQIAQYMAHFKA